MTDSTGNAIRRRISEIAKREKEATPGNWFVQHELNVMAPDPRGGAFSPFSNSWLSYEDRKANILFAAHARADIPFLLSELASERQAVIEECCRAAQPAAGSITKMVDIWLEKMNLPTSNKEGKQIFTQTLQDVIELAIRSME